MLKKFSVSGFKSFKKKVILDLGNPNDYQFNKELIKNGCVKNALIYGKNASGKSNLGFAIFDIVMTLTDNYYAATTHYENYINLDLENPYAEFQYSFLLKDYEIEYLYRKIDVETIIYEKLIIDKQTVLEIQFDDIENKKIAIAGAENLNWQYFNGMSAVRYIANNIPLDQENPIALLMSFVNHMLWFRGVESNSFIGLKNTSSKIDEVILKNDKLKDFEKFLRENGIHYKLVEMNETSRKQIGVVYQNGILPFDVIASTGTKDLRLFYCWKIDFEKESHLERFVFIDEFDANYHFDLALNIVTTLKNMENLQTILTTHNTYLMSNSISRPDCTFICTPTKITSLPNATDKELREAHNIEKLYRGGHFIE